MITHRAKRVGVGSAVVLMVLSACQSVPTEVFTLSPVRSDAPAIRYSGRPVRLDAVHVPPALDRIEILSEVAPGEWRVEELDHWAAPLGQLVRQALTADLVARLPAGRVIFPRLAKPAGSLGLSVDLLAFSADRYGATMEVSWVGSAGGSEPPACGGTMVLRTALSAAGSAAIARALSALVGQLADRIAAELLLSAPAQPES